MRLVRNPRIAIRVGIIGALASPLICHAGTSEQISAAASDAIGGLKYAILAFITLAAIGFGAAAIVVWMKG